MWFVTLQSINNFAPAVLHDIQNEYHAAVLKTNIFPRSASKEETCVTVLVNISSELVGYILAAMENGLKTRYEVTWIVENIRQSLRLIINETPWLDAQSRAAARKKVDYITHFISFSNFNLDLRALENYYSNVSMGENYYFTLITMLQNSRRSTLSAILSQNRLDHKSMMNLNPASAQAAYYPNHIHLAVSSALTGFPFFNHGLEALNYAAMGFLIGHEMGHSFDRQGIRLKWNGEMKSWLSIPSEKEYKKQEKCFQDSYGKFHFKDIKKNVNGDSTLSENIADSIGFAAALRAYRMRINNYGAEPKLIYFENFTHDQLFTLAFANIWCKNALPQHVKEMIETQIHAPDSARVNGALMNSKEFANIWNCEAGTTMNPEDKCAIFS